MARRNDARCEPTGRRQVLDSDAVGRAQPPTTAAPKPGSVQSGRSARRAVEPLGEFDDQAFGSADVAEQERVLRSRRSPDRFPAGLSHAVDDATHVVDLEGDVPEPGRFAAGAGSRAPAEGDWKRTTSNISLPSWARAITTSTVTFSRPMIRSIHSPLNTPGSPQSKPKQRKKPDCLVEVLDDKTDVDEVGDAGPMAVH
jgi:hypothetical protein